MLTEFEILSCQVLCNINLVRPLHMTGTKSNISLIDTKEVMHLIDVYRFGLYVGKAEKTVK